MPMSRSIILYGFYDVIFQKTVLFRATAGRTSSFAQVVFTWKTYVVFFTLPCGYFHLGCDVMGPGGNLQMCWKNMHNFVGHLQYTFCFKPYTTKN